MQLPLKLGIIIIPEIDELKKAQKMIYRTDKSVEKLIYLYTAMVIDYSMLVKAIR